jgi:hypothetical protein
MRICQRCFGRVAVLVLGCTGLGPVRAAGDPATQTVVDWNVIALRTVQTGEPLLSA